VQTEAFAKRKKNRMLSSVLPHTLSSTEVWGLPTSDLLDYLEDLEIIEVLQGKLNKTVRASRFEVISELRRRCYTGDPLDWGDDGI